MTFTIPASVKQLLTKIFSSKRNITIIVAFIVGIVQRILGRELIDEASLAELTAVIALVLGTWFKSEDPTK